MARRLLIGFALCVATLAAAAVAAATTCDIYQRHYTAADQALARSIVLRRANLDQRLKWIGTPRPADTSNLGCPDYRPREADLVITGYSSYDYKSANQEIFNEVDVFQSSQMVQLDWQRQIGSRNFLSCIRSRIIANSPAFVSIVWAAVPHIAPRTAELRILDKVQGGFTMTDVIFMVRGRTEIALTTTTPYATVDATEASEVRLARLLVARTPG